MAKRVAQFQKQILVRPLKPEDYEAVCRLQLVSFPQMKPWSAEQYASQLAIFPEGQICVELRGEIVASSSALIREFSIYEEGLSWKVISDSGFIRTHTTDGDTLYGIEIMVHPKYRGMRLARRLYEARKEIARKHNLRRIIIGGRIPGYAEHQKKMTARQYVEKVLTKELFDPVLTTQIGNDFVLKRLIKSYLDADKESDGWATMLEWTNIDYLPPANIRYLATHPVRACAVQYQMREIKGFDDFARQCEYFVDVAGEYQSDFVLFPELFTLQLLSFFEPLRPGLAARKVAEFTPQYVELFTHLAVKYNTNIIGGTHFIIEENKLFNAAFLFKRDGTYDQQKKIHITQSERRWWGLQGGEDLRVFETDKGKIGILVCYDAEFPELARILALKGAEILFVPFSTDERYGYLRVRYCVQARCIENHVFAVAAGTVGNLPFVDNMNIQYAQSGIFTPSDIPFSRDAIAAEATPNVEMVVFDDLDLMQLRRSRDSGTVMNLKDRRTDLYQVYYKGKTIEDTAENNKIWKKALGRTDAF